MTDVGITQPAKQPQKVVEKFESRIPPTEQTLVWYVVPNGYSLKNATTLKASVVVSPFLRHNLAPDQAFGNLPEGTLPLLAYPDFMDWPQRIRDITEHDGFKLQFRRDNNAPVTLPAEVVSEKPVAELWQAVFNSDTIPVRSYQFNIRSKLLIRPIFPRKFQSTIDEVYRGVAGNKQQLINPAVRDDFLKQNLITELQGLIKDSPLSFTPNLRRQMGAALLKTDTGAIDMNSVIADEEKAFIEQQKLLDEQLQKNLQQQRGQLGPRVQSSPLDHIIPPAQAADEKHPMPSWDKLSVSVPSKADLKKLLDQSTNDLSDMEFHLAVNLLQEYPELLRWLGLVVDVEVSFKDADKLHTLYNKDQTGLQVCIIPGNVTNQLDDSDSSARRYHLMPWTACVLSETEFFTASYHEAAKSTPESFITKRMLHMEQRDKYKTTQLDEDGAALSVLEFAERQARNQASVKDPSQQDNRLPALRSAGLGVNFIDRIDRQKKIIRRAVDLNFSIDLMKILLNRGVKKINTPVVYAEDLMRGLRVDVYDTHSDKRRWYPLCRRELEYTFLGLNKPLPGKDTQAEGQITSQLSKFKDEVVELGEEAWQVNRMGDMLFRWEGWSLSVPRCADPNVPHPADSDCGKNAVNKLNLRAQHRVAPCTLPQLRFGRTYQFRARIVDIAGNSLAPPDPANADPDVNKEIHCTAPFTYRRFTPLGAPVVVPLSQPNPKKFAGESVMHLAIRSDYDELGLHYYPSHRHVLPPPVYAELAEHHGRFDNVQCQMQCGFDIAQCQMQCRFKNPQCKVQYTEVVKKLVQRSTRNVLGQEREKQTIGNFFNYKSYVLTDQYLPDPLARGLSLSGLPHTDKPLVIYYGGIGIHNGKVTKDAWPNLGALHLILVEGDKPPVLQYVQNSAPGYPVLKVSLPKAEVVKLSCSSVMSKTELELMAIWDWVKQDTKAEQLQDLEAQAVQGQHWMLTPAAEITLVHAVQKPLQVSHFIPVLDDSALPLVKPDTLRRELGATWAYLDGIVQLHGKSTGSVSITASWQQIINDPSQELGIRKEERRRQVLDTSVDMDGEVHDKVNEGAVTYFASNGDRNDALVLGGHAYQYLEQLQVKGTKPRKDSRQLAGRFAQLKSSPQKAITDLNAPHQDLGDTQHHSVTYTVIATTRFREYFTPLRQDNVKLGRDAEVANFTRPDQSKKEQAIKSIEVHVPNSVRPAAPNIAYIVPTFGWGMTQSGKTITKERKGNGLRVYMEGPWYSSGEDELLGVVINNSVESNKLSPLDSYTTQWAKDPIWSGAASASGLPEPPQLKHFKAEDGEKVNGLSLDELPQQGNVISHGGVKIWTPYKVNIYKVAVAAYPVHFDQDKGLWYSDIVIDGVDAYFPFIRLALARYQPYSVEHTHLSRVALADFIQLTPDRFANLQRSGDNRTIDITVSGPAPEDSYAVHNTEMFGKLIGILLGTKGKSPPATGKATHGWAVKQGGMPPAMVKQLQSGKTINVMQVELEKVIPGVTDADLKWQTVAHSTVILKPQAKLIASGHQSWAGQLKLPTAYKPHTYRVVIREYEVFINGRRLVYADTVEL